MNEAISDVYKVEDLLKWQYSPHSSTDSTKSSQNLKIHIEMQGLSVHKTIMKSKNKV